MLEKLIELAEANRVVRVEGPNGSGKSTLLLNYQFHLSDSGLDFGVLSQHEMVLEELTGHELFSIAEKPEAEKWLSELGGSSSINKRLVVMSSGEKSKVLIALALCSEIVVLDEPLAHLDNQSRAKLEEIIASSNARFVIANHELGAFEFATSLTLGHCE